MEDNGVPVATSEAAAESRDGVRPKREERPAAAITWRSANGSAGEITFNPDGWPRIEIAPTIPGSADEWCDGAGSGDFRIAVTIVGAAADSAPAEARSSGAIELYLNLMKACLTRIVFRESGPPIDPGTKEFDAALRAEGRDWPADAETMAGLRRLENVQHCVEDVLRHNVRGDLIETGVWRGGTTIFMRAILAAYGDTSRLVWVADSFEGLPKPDTERYPADQGWDLSGFSQLAVSLEQVQENFARYGLLDDRVRFLKGWFKDTLPTAPIERLAVLRLDGDLYESTMDALAALYPKLSSGGYAIVDDYGAIPACRQAVHDYRDAHKIREPIVEVDWTGAYWQRMS